MQITLITVGKIRTKWISTGVKEYADRLRRFGRINIIEVLAEDIAANASMKDRERALSREAGRILSAWPKNAFAFGCDRCGEMLGSEELARKMGKLALSGRSHLLFVIGGSYGLCKEVIDSCSELLSFGPNTFPHSLFRILLLEQLYRAEKIRAGETYHK